MSLHPAGASPRVDLGLVGVLVTMAPAWWLFARPSLSEGTGIAALTIGLGFAVAGALTRRGWALSRWLVAALVGVAALYAAFTHTDAPGFVLATWLVLVMVVATAFPTTPRVGPPAAAVLGAASVATVALVFGGVGGASHALTWFAFGLTALAPVGVAAWTGYAAHLSASRLLVSAGCAGAAGFAAAVGEVGVATGLALVPPLVLVRDLDALPDGLKDVVGVLLQRPAAMLVGSFAALCVLGTAVLSLPAAHAGDPIEVVDAAFTAVSAACVTGLGVRDTGGDFSWFGQFVLLVLIQVGGLGIMTFAGVGLLWAGRRMTIREERATVGAVGGWSQLDVRGALRRVLWITLGAEAVGAIALFVRFVSGGEAAFSAAWRAVFTSISAFCNAGFALQSDSMVGYADDPFVLGVVGGLVIVGGLGPAVVADLPALMRGQPVSLHSRYVTFASLGLVLAGGFVFLVIEWSHQLGAMPVGHRVTNALFQSIILRTAGFNSVDIAALQPATWTLCLILMFIGGAPGSTAGGVKVTAAGVLALSVWATLRRAGRPVVLGRRLGAQSVHEALAICSAGALILVLGLVALQLTQPVPVDLLLFEAVSALGTVGLTAGATAKLDAVGKVIVMGLMFAGRVGPLSLLALLSEESDDAAATAPDGTLTIG